jgi:hypothetical protein
VPGHGRLTVANAQEDFVNKVLVAAFLVLTSALSLQAQQWAGSDTITGTIYRSGNVGIGMTTPLTLLEIPGSTSNASAKFGSFEIQGYALNNAWMGDNVYFNGGFRRRADGAGTLLYFYQGSFAIRTFPFGAAGPVAPDQRFIILADGTVGLGGTQTVGTTSGARMIITAAGNVGIGVSPTHRLHVAGSGRFTGDLVVDGNIAAKYQDIAEWVPAAEPLQPGTVVVLDTSTPNQVMTSRNAYDAKVAGVVSAQPGLILGEPAEGAEQIATTGRVRVKVDATKHPIRIGDLLVTSDTPGYAMYSEPLTLGGVAIHRPGTIIGKALESLPDGRGEILVLLSMQ